MQSIKYRKPTKKTLAYLRRMISGRHWKVNEKIPPISEIGEKVGVSAATVRKAIHKLEDEKIIVNHGSLGFFVVSKTRGDLYRKYRKRYMIENAEVLLNSAKLLNEGGIHIGKFILHHKDDNLTVINTVSGKKQKYKIEEVMNAIECPVRLEDINNAHGNKIKLLRRRWNREKTIQDITPHLFANRRRLDIKWTKN